MNSVKKIVDKLTKRKLELEKELDELIEKKRNNSLDEKASRIFKRFS